MSDQTVFVGMLKLLEGGKRWTKRTSARDPKGRACSWRHPDAKRFCLIGAFLRVAGEEAPTDPLQKLSFMVGSLDLSEWNDAQPHFGEVGALLKAAIEGGK